MPTKREKRAKQKDEYTEIGDRLDKKTGFSASYLKIPDSIPQWQPSKEEHRLNILPYRVGDGNPYADKGKLHFERTIYVHKNIGPNKSTYCCPAKVKNKPCPVCAWIEKQRKKMDDEELKDLDLFPKERQLFLIQDLDDLEKGVQLWDYSFHLFGKQLDNKLRRIKGKNEGDSRLRFWKLEGGRVVVVEFEKKKYQGKPFFSTDGIGFAKRKKDLDVSLDDLPCLDEIPYCIKPEKLKEIFLQTPEADDSDDDEDDDDEETKKRKKKRKKEEDDEEEEEDEDDEEDGDLDDSDSGDDDNGEEDDDEETDDDEDADGSDDDEDDDEDEDSDDGDEDDEEGDEDDEDEDEDDDDEDDEEDEEDDDEDSDDEDEKPVKKKKKVKAKKGKREVPFDTDDDEEDSDDDEDDEEEADDGEEDEDEGEEEDEEDDPTAEEAGIEVGMKVKHKKHGKCKVVHISPDGTSLRLETADGETVRGVAPSEVTVLKKVKKK